MLGAEIVRLCSLPVLADVWVSPLGVGFPFFLALALAFVAVPDTTLHSSFLLLSIAKWARLHTATQPVVV
jgi:hypothetical protein